jgi:cobalt-zinc-cadmium efflux system outer membrane protein
VPGDELAALRARKPDAITIGQARPGEARGGGAAFNPADGLDEAELVAVALTLNPRLRAKRLEIGEAESLLIGAGLWPNPELGIAVRPGIDGATSTGIELDALLALLRPGERKARRGVALARLDTVRAEIAALEFQVVAEARKARIGVLAADANARLLEGEAALREEASRLLHGRKELGEATDLDVLLVDLELVGIQRELREAQADRQRARRALNELLGLPAAYEVKLAESARGFSIVVVDVASDEELDQRILSGRFDLRAKEAEYRQAEEELRLAVARQYQGLSLGPSFEKDVEGSKALGLGAGIELPLFDRNQGEVAERYAARERARAEYVSTLHALRAAAFEARAELERARAEVELQQRQVLPLIERTEALFEGAFRARELSIFEWITARTRAVQARRELLRTLVRYTGAVADLEAALGAPPATQAGENTHDQDEER